MPMGTMRRRCQEHHEHMNTLDGERGGADTIEDISGDRNMTGDVPDKDSSPVTPVS